MNGSAGRQDGITSRLPSSAKDAFHDLINGEVRRRPGLAVLYTGRSLEECVDWRLKIQASMFDIVMKSVKSDAARKLLTEYQLLSAGHLKQLGTPSNPLSKPPYPQRMQEFSEVWQQFQLADR